jgi:ATP-dependent Clp protease ATP-binding subunit ClpA
MTSNLGVAVRDQNLGFLGSADIDRNREAQAGEVREAVRRAFAPEFRNRIDAEVIFHALAGDAVLRGILALQIAEVAAALQEKQIRLIVDDSVYEALLREGYNRKFGARDLRRTVNRFIRDPLAEEMLAGRFRPGQTVRAAGDGGRVVFEAALEEPR